MQFEPKVSPIATKVDFNSLSDSQKADLTRKVSFNPSTHDIFNIGITVKPAGDPTRPESRKEKKTAYEGINRVEVETRVGAKDIQFFGIMPQPRPVGETETMPVTAPTGDPLISLDILGQKISMGKELFNLFRKIGRSKKWSVRSAYQEDWAHWWFYNDYILNMDFGVHVLCVAPKNLANHQRFLRCDAIFFSGNNRCVKRARSRQVILP